MPIFYRVTSPSDPALDPYTRLTENQLKNRKHPESGVFIAESEPVIRLALDAGYVPLSVLGEEKHLSGAAAETVGRCGDIPVYCADAAAFGTVTGFVPSRGLLAVMKRPVLPTVEEVCAGASRIAVFENVTDAGNLGAMIRSAAALGIDGVLLSPSCCDPLLRRAARVSMGTVFQIPWTYLGTSPAEWPGEGMARLKRMGFLTAAMALKNDTLRIDDPRLKGADRLALLLGTEGTGLTEETVRLADETVKIPMFHGVDSLNVAAASAVAFWETRKTEKTNGKEANG